jgi:hypothetical protein
LPTPSGNCSFLALVDDELASKVLRLTHSCHSGSIWDLNTGMMPGGTEQGIYQFSFFKLLTDQPNQTPNQMESEINQI